MERGKNQISEAGSVAFGHGDVIHVKLPSGSWWPAQVVYDEAILPSFQPRKSRNGEVLVRIYGSQEFLNVNPVRSCAEFEMILKNNNADLKKILQEGLQKDLPSSKKSASKAKGTPSKKSNSKAKSNKKAEEQTPAKRQKQNKESKDGDLANPSCETTASGKLQELSSRRIRVMQSLGLVAPLGSPFTKVKRNCKKIP